MSDIAETYLVISLLMAVFAAVAAVGTALVLGVGFERLRNGFELVRKQTAFFSDEIRKLGESTSSLDRRTSELERHSAILDQKTAVLEVHQNDLAMEISRAATAAEKSEAGDYFPGQTGVLVEEALDASRKVRSRYSDIAGKEGNKKRISLTTPSSIMQFAIADQDGKSGNIIFH